LALILVDTCIIIDHLRNRAEATAFLKQLEQLPLVSVLTLAELQAGVRNREDEKLLDRVIADWPVVVLDAPTARLGGSLWRRFGPSHGTGIMDAMLAATAQRERARLATINRRHFPMFDDLLVPY
jgi:predicted nucleic acid-binding protein